MGPFSIGNQSRQLLTEIVRFLVVGGVATVVSVLGFNALVHGTLLGTAPLARHPIPAYVLVNAVAGCVAYLGMQLWAFSHREVRDPMQSVVRFFGLGSVTMVIPVLCLAVSRYLLGLSDPWADNISANVVGLSLGTAARFWVFRRYVFFDVTPAIPERRARRERRAPIAAFVPSLDASGARVQHRCSAPGCAGN